MRVPLSWLVGSQLIVCILDAVEKLLGSAQPSVEFTRKKYVEAHDAIVASAAYTSALETAAHVLNKAITSFLQRPHWLSHVQPALP